MSLNYIRDIDGSSHRDVGDIDGCTGACRDIFTACGVSG